MIAMECPKCNARPPDGYGHQCSDGRWIIVPGEAVAPPPPPDDVLAQKPGDEQENEALARWRMANELRHDIEDGARRADAMARLEADLRRPA